MKRVKDENKKTWDSIHQVLAKGEFDKAREMVNKDTSAMAQMLGMGLARQGAVRRREDIEIAMEESMMEIIPQLEKRTQYLALLSNIATLFGLLGTIMGLIDGLYGSCRCKPSPEGIPSRGQYFDSHELHCVWSDVRDPTSITSRAPDNNNGKDCEQPGNGIGKGGQYHFDFR